MTDEHGKAPVGHLNGGSSIKDPIIKIQPPRSEDLQPSVAHVIKPDTEDASMHSWYGSMITGLGAIIGTCGAIPGCVICPNPYKRVNQGQVGLVTRFGRFDRAVDPGLVRVNPLSEKLIQVDVKVQFVEVPKQVCMTKDNVSLWLTSVIYYRITSPHRAAFGINNVRQALVERTQTTLRHVVGSHVLQDVVERREEITQDIRDIVERVAEGWGIEVESMLIKDMIFSEELQESLSMAAQSKRTGEAKIITARAEVESAKLMRQAADILSSAPAMQIRYLEAMQQMAHSANSKVIFLPAQNQTVQASMAKSFSGEGSSQSPVLHGSAEQEFGQNTQGFQSAINSSIIEHM